MPPPVSPTRPALAVIGATGLCVLALGLLTMRSAAWTWGDLALIFIGGMLCFWGAFLLVFCALASRTGGEHKP